MGIHHDMGQSSPYFQKRDQKEIDLAYLREAYKLASKYSDDYSTQNGALIVKDNSVFDLSEDNLLGSGVNKLPEGIKRLEKRLQRPGKYSLFGHAEKHAVCEAAKYGNATKGSKMYLPWFPCSGCTVQILGAGIEELIFHEKVMNWGNGKLFKDQIDWDEDFKISYQMLDEKSDISYRFVDGDIGDVEILFKGEKRRP